MRRALLAALLFMGCEGEPANVFEKSSLGGRWRYDVELVDAPPAVAVMIQKTAAPVAGFEALEDYLIVRSDGDPLAAWPIAAHFDEPPREADPGDGIIYENGLRPWWQRELMRVDFSRELVADLAGWTAWPDGITVEPVAYLVPFERRVVDGELVALEIVDRLLVGDVRVTTRHTFTRE